MTSNAHQIIYKLSLTAICLMFFSWLHWGDVFLEEDHNSEVSFSKNKILLFYCYSDTLLVLILISNLYNFPSAWRKSLHMFCREDLMVLSPLMICSPEVFFISFSYLKEKIAGYNSRFLVLLGEFWFWTAKHPLFCATIDNLVSTTSWVRTIQSIGKHHHCPKAGNMGQCSTLYCIRFKNNDGNNTHIKRNPKICGKWKLEYIFYYSRFLFPYNAK